MDSMANGGVESSAESLAPAAEAEEEVVPKSSPAAAATKGRGLRRWRRIRRDQLREGYMAAGAAAGSGGGGADEDSAQLHKRRLPLAAGAPKGKHEAALVEEESSTASVESSFVPPAPPTKLDPGLGLLIASAGLSVGAGGADSDNSEDRGSRSSTAASAPRVFPRHGHDALLIPRERDRPRSRAPGASLHGKSSRTMRSRADKARVHAVVASTEAENSRSSVESDLRISNALKPRQLCVGVTGNGVHKVLSDYCDHSDDEQPSEEPRSSAGGYNKRNDSSVVGRLIRRSADSGDDVDTFDEGSVGKVENGRKRSGADPYAESILLLQRTQEALENEIENFVVIGKQTSDDFDVLGDEWSGSVHLEEPIEEASERIKHLESRVEAASALIKEKDSRILQLEALSRMQPGKTATDSFNLLLPQSDLDQLYQEKMEAEIHCIILSRAHQTWATLAEDQMALYEAQKALCEDYKQLGLKLRYTENRATMLEEMAKKLQEQCKGLSRSSEVLQLQSKASRVSLFFFIQLILVYCYRNQSYADLALVY